MSTEPDHVDPGASDFASLGLSPALRHAALNQGWAAPTAVQRASIPPLLAGHDLCLRSATGSGKTAAYLLPLLQQLLAEPGLDSARPRRLRLLVLAPTRELAAQIGLVAQQLAPALKAVIAVGGLSINPQLMALRGGAHLVVATPGRLLDLLRQRGLQLDDVRHCVLDEADRLLELGFADEMLALRGLLPARRQTLLCSATWPVQVEQLAKHWLREPVAIDVAPDLAPVEAAADGSAGAAPAIVQRAIVVDSAQRTALLRHLLKTQRWDRVLVFVATQYASEHVALKLKRAGLAAAALHGQLSQGRRSEVLAQFHQGRLKLVVATDLAARGIHIERLAAVVNYDLPRSATDYTHRIGRTGRAGAAGEAVSFVAADAPGSEARFRLIEKRQAQRVPRETLAGFEPQAAPAAPLGDPHGGIKGRRPSKKDKLREAAARKPPAA